MKLFLVLFIVFSIQITHSKEMVLISDIDDTLKRTHVLGNFSGGPFFDNDFTGIDLLFRILICRNNFSQMPQLVCQNVIFERPLDDNGVYYVTAAASFLNYWGKKFLKKNKYPVGKFFYRPNFSDSTYTFKFDTIEKILKDHENDQETQVIMLGDNGEKDPEIYEMISKRFENSKVQIHSYIHQVYSYSENYDEVGVKLRHGQKPFLTAIDLAVDFYLRKWIHASDVMIVYQSVMNKLLSPKDKDAEKVIPTWMRCHEYFSEFTKPDVGNILLELQLDLYYYRLEEICHNRSLEE